MRGDNVEIIHFLADIGMPYSCTEWGDSGTPDIPPISIAISSDNMLIRDWFPEDPITGAEYPITIFINHNMQIINITFGSLTLEDTNLYINCMLDAM